MRPHTLTQNLTAALTAALTLALSACASDAYISAASDAGPALQARQSKIIVLRTDKQAAAPTYNLHVNGQYHASMLRGTWTEFNLCAGPAKMLLTPDAAILNAPRLATSEPLTLTQGQTSYYLANDGVFTALDPAAGAQLQAQLKPTRHSISRLSAPNC